MFREFSSIWEIQVDSVQPSGPTSPIETGPRWGTILAGFPLRCASRYDKGCSYVVWIRWISALAAVLASWSRCRCWFCSWR